MAARGQVFGQRVLETGERKRYLAITNLTAQEVGLMDKLIHYYHQIAFQAAVVNLGTDTDFVEFGTRGIRLDRPGNKHYQTNDLLAHAVVPTDYNWLSTHIETLTRFWLEVIQYRETHPGWDKPRPNVAPIMEKVVEKWTPAAKRPKLTAIPAF